MIKEQDGCKSGVDVSAPKIKFKEKSNAVFHKNRRTKQRHEKSCGAIVFRVDDNGEAYVLMIKHRSGGHMSFPKGHVEANETERMTAVREVCEETSVKIEIIEDFRKTVYYTSSPGVRKEVVYFFALTKQTDIKPRPGEIAEVAWIKAEKAESRLTHENDKTVFRAARQYFEQLNT